MYHYFWDKKDRPIAQLFSTLLSVRELQGSIPDPVKLDTGRQLLATVATFRNCVAPAPCRVEGPTTRYTLREYTES